jgi:hypothetical protein
LNSYNLNKKIKKDLKAVILLEEVALIAQAILKIYSFKIPIWIKVRDLGKSQLKSWKDKHKHALKTVQDFNTIKTIL